MRKLRSSGSISSINASASVSVLEQVTDMLRGVSADVSQVLSEWNANAYPILSTLPQGAADSRWDMDDTVNPWVNGLDGANFFVDNYASTEEDGGKYWRSDLSRPKTVKESLADLYTEILNSTDSVRTEIASSGAGGDGVTPAAKARIGANIFDTNETSAADSLDALTLTNRANILQMAKDMYDDLYDNLTGNGVESLDNYSVRDMVQALLLLHGGAWNTSIDLTHDGIGGSIGAIYRTFCGGTNEETTTTSEVVVGGFTFDPSQFGTAIGSMNLHFEGLLTYVAAGSVGSAYLYLYDMGAPGSITAGTLRSTLNTGTTRNLLTQERNTLSAVTSPSSANQIHNAERVYEIRLKSDGLGDPADVARMTWGGIYIEVTS